MQKIIPHLWFDKEAREAAEFYVAAFGGEGTKMNTTQVLPDTPSGDAETVSFSIRGYEIQAISAGPYFKLNPSISFGVSFETKEEVSAMWEKLVEGGKVLMPLQAYPFSEWYGWLDDKYGVSWQLIYFGNGDKFQITPALMYVGENTGKAEEAVNFYASIFKDSSVGEFFRYRGTEGEGTDKQGTVAHVFFNLAGQRFSAMDSAGPHQFNFNEAVSLIVMCEDQAEIDYFWEKFGVKEGEGECGWLKDKYGVSWQIVPKRMDEMMAEGTPEQIARVVQAFLPMKKIEIAPLEKAYRGE